MDTQRDLMNVIYGTGYDDGVKAGKTEVVNELMKITLEWKASSDVVSCDTIMKLLKQRKDSIEEERCMDKPDILLETSEGNPPIDNGAKMTLSPIKESVIIERGCDAYDYESGKCKDTNKPCDMCYENTKNLN